MTLESVRETLLKLVTTHYVERCPAPEPVLTPPKDDAPAPKRGSKVFAYSCKSYLPVIFLA